MALAVQCPGCGKRLIVRDTLSGKPVKCPACGQALVVKKRTTPAPTSEPAAPAKICVVCKKDCSGVRRFKDTDGNYFHPDCFDAFSWGQVSIKAPEPPDPHEPESKMDTMVLEGGAQLLAEALDRDAADDPPESAPETPATCSHCGKPLSPDTQFCRSCGNRRQVQA